MLPDLDVLVYYSLSSFGFSINEVHRTLSHTLFFPLLFVLLGLLSFRVKKFGRMRLRAVFFVIAFGIFMHLVLDALLAGGITPLYPLYLYTLGVNLIGYLPVGWQDSFLPSLDALLLILWLISLEFRHKLSDFI